MKEKFFIGIGLGLIMILGLWFRVFNLDKAKSWQDEIDAIKMVETHSPLDSFLLYGQPPLHYASLWAIDRLGNVFSFDVISVERYLSVVLSFMGIVAAFWLGKEVFKEDKYGLVVALVVACMQLQIYYAQEIRMYAMWSLWAILSWAAFWRLIRGKNGTYLLILFNFLALATHTLSVIFLLSQLGVALWLWFGEKKKINRIVIVDLLLLLVFGLLIPTIVSYGEDYTNRGMEWGAILKPFPYVTDFWDQVRLFRRLSGIEYSKILGLLSVFVWGFQIVKRKTRAVGVSILLVFLISMGSLHVMLALGVLHLFATRYLIYLSGMYALLWPNVARVYKENRVLENIILGAVIVMYLGMSLNYVMTNPIHFDQMP